MMSVSLFLSLCEVSVQQKGIDVMGILCYMLSLY